MIYLDNAATTPMKKEVFDAMMPYLTDNFGNAGSKHSAGRAAIEAIERARTQVATFLNCAPEQIIFTSGGTEANNLAILGLESYLCEKNRKNIMISPFEHDSVMKSVDFLCTKREFHEDRIYPSRAVEILKSDKNKYGLLSYMYVNNEIGDEYPIEEIATVCRENGAVFHTDCVQAAPCKKLNVDEIGCDFLSISSHKIHGPKGAGALFVRDKRMLSSILHGGSAQEHGLRAGTENTAAIVGFGMACEAINKDSIYYQRNMIRMRELKNLFCEYIRKLFYNSYLRADEIFHVNSNSESDSGILNVRFDGIDSETLLLMLDSQGVCVSSGAACSEAESKPSHVLLASGLSPNEARNSIRISMSDTTTEDDIRDAAIIITRCVTVLHTDHDKIIALLNRKQRGFQ